MMIISRFPDSVDILRIDTPVDGEETARTTISPDQPDKLAT